MKSKEITLELIAKVLIRSFWIGIASVTAWFLIYLGGGDWGYNIHKDLWSGLTRHEYDLINLCGMAFLKLGVFGVFLLPYLGIRMVLRQDSEPIEDPS